MAVLNRTLARAQPKAALRLTPIVLVAGAAIVVLSVLRVVQTSEATTSSFAIQRLEEDKLELEASVRQLEAEVAQLSSLERIEREAERLGLVTPVARESVTVNVAWPGADEERLPARFAPEEGAPADGEGDDAAWWQDLLKVLPFY